MFIEIIPSGPFATNAYVVACPETKETAIIDPAPESAEDIIRIIEENNLTPTKILLTHSHWDHIGDTAKLKQKYSIPVIIHPDDAPNLENPGSDGLPLMFEIEGVKPDQYLNENESVSVGNLKFKVILTPGHTPGGVCFYCKEQNVLISGDTLFQGSIGNLSFPTANADKMWDSLDTLAKLPKETHVYPGHGPSTTIAQENWLTKAREIFGY